MPGTDAVDEIRTAAVERIADFQNIFAVFGNRAAEQRVGIESAVIGKGNTVVFAVFQFQNALEITVKVLYK